MRSNIRRYAALAVIFSLPFVPLPDGNLWLREVYNSGHIILFMALSFVLYRQFKATTHFSYAFSVYLLILFVGIAFAVIIELLQSFVHRDASINDIYGDVFGLMAGLCVIAAYELKDIQYKKVVAAILLASSGGFILFGASPLLQLSWHYYERYKAFPVIMDFRADWSSDFVRFNKTEVLSNTSASQSGRYFPVRFMRGRYPSVSVIEPEPDWSSYHTLRINVFSEEKSDVVMTIRIHDNKHNQEYSDRFNIKILLQSGLNEIKLPLDKIERGPIRRKLDLVNVASIGLSLNGLNEPVLLDVGNIYLE